MFVLSGDAFPNDTQSLRAALAHGARLHGAADGAVTAEGDFPSLEALRMDLTGVHLDALKPHAAAPESAEGGFFTRALEIIAEPALLAGIPIRFQVRAEDCVFAMGASADGMRSAAVQSCTRGSVNASAAVADIETALLSLARDAASKHGADVESVRVTLAAESPRALAVTAVAIAKAMFFTATLTIRGRVTLDDELNLRLAETGCTGDGMLANLAAAQLRPQIAKLEGRAVSIQSFLPAGMRISDVALEGGAALKIRATLTGR